MHGACVTDAELQMQTQERKKRDEREKKTSYICATRSGKKGKTVHRYWCMSPQILKGVLDEPEE